MIVDRYFNNTRLASRFSTAGASKISLVFFSIPISRTGLNARFKRREDSCIRPRLNRFLAEADGRNGISTIREIRDNEQNKRSEEKQKSPALASRRRRVRARRCCCPARKMEGEFSRARPLVAPLLPAFLRGCARAASLFLSRPPEGRERATKGGKTRERNYRREGTTATMDTVGVVASGGEADQYFCTRAPSGSGPWHRGALSPTS